MNRYVVTCRLGPSETPLRREIARNTALAQTLADIRGDTFAGEYDPTLRYARPLYFVPHKTVVDAAIAAEAGIRSSDDLYGGVVPREHLATKAIMHRLVSSDAPRPRGWSPRFAEAIGSTVLPGFTVFDRPSAYRAAARLLQDGLARCKRTTAAGGCGQYTISSLPALEPILAAVGDDELTRCGLVVERHLNDVVTYSVGQIQVGDLTASYYGTQRWTRDNAGGAAYGGSDLAVVRGGYRRLLALDLPEHLRLAVWQAAAFDLAVNRWYPGVVISRRNYDVGQGHDVAGRVLSGVLDQSWRIGGASGAELVALQALRDDPALELVEASCYERYGADVMLPPGAVVHFDGAEAASGPIRLYTVVQRTVPRDALPHRLDAPLAIGGLSAARGGRAWALAKRRWGARRGRLAVAGGARR